MLKSYARQIGAVAVIAVLSPVILAAQDPAGPPVEFQKAPAADHAIAENGKPRVSTLRQSITAEARRQAEASAQAATSGPAKKRMTVAKKIGIGAAIAAAVVGAYFFVVLQRPS